jgi:plastocyanin
VKADSLSIVESLLHFWQGDQKTKIPRSSSRLGFSSSSQKVQQHQQQQQQLQQQQQRTMKLTLTTPTASAWLWLVAAVTFSSSSSSSSTVMAETIDIEWSIPGSGGSLPDVTAKVGDTLNFVWTSGTHNVYIHPNQDCDFGGSTEVGGTSPVTYELTDANVPSIYFACQIGPHCSLGQHVLVTVEEEAAEIVVTLAPTELPIAIADPPPGSNVTLPEDGTDVTTTPAPSVEGTAGIGPPIADEVMAPTEAPVMAPVAASGGGGRGGSNNWSSSKTTVWCILSGMAASVWFLVVV